MRKVSRGVARRFGVVVVGVLGVLLWGALAACGSGQTPASGGGGAGGGGARAGGGAGSGSGVVVHRGTGGVLPPGTSGAPQSAAIVPDVGCLAPTCAYHANTATYFTCLSGGSGDCFHFGAPCTPVDNCMFDAAGKAYKSCSHAVEGQCIQWAAATCAPASACMFDPDDGLHHHCDEIAGGACKRYGALCAP